MPGAGEGWRAIPGDGAGLRSVEIATARVVPYDVALRRPLRTASGAVDRRYGWIVSLAGLVGGRRGAVARVEGAGESAPHPAAAPGDRAATASALERAVGALVGRRLPLDDPARTAAAIRGELAGRSAVVAMGLEMALLDLVSRAREEPLWRFLRRHLAGNRAGAGAAPGQSSEAGPDVPPDAPLVEASALLPGDDPVEEARRASAAGFPVVKWKGRAGPGGTIDGARAILAAVPGLRLRIDPNGSWSEGQASELAGALGGELDWLEQPLPPGQLAAHARLQREGRVAIALDEEVRGVESVVEIGRRGAAGIVVLKLVQVGGILTAMECARRARSAGLDFTITTGLDGAIATAAALHLAAALGPGMRPCGLATSGLLAEDVGSPVPRPVPAMRVPAGHGLGVQPASSGVRAGRAEREAAGGASRRRG